MTSTYDPDQMFKLLDHTGKIIASGSMSAVTEPILDSKSRAEAIALRDAAATALDLIAQQQEQAEELRARQVSAFCDGVARLTRRLDQMEQQREEKMRADVEEEARRVQAELDQMPDPDDPPIYGPSGELHVLSADPGADPGTADQGALLASLREHEEQQLEADQGGLPKELELEAPPPGGAYPLPEALAYPTTPRYRTPAAVSMMSEDD